jgi:hypothetical protein
MAILSIAAEQSIIMLYCEPYTWKKNSKLTTDRQEQ